MKHTRLAKALLFALGSSAITSVQADTEVNSFSDAVKNGQANLMFRYRFEGVDQVGFPDDAQANTFLSRVTLKTAPLKSWHAVVEFDHIAELNDKDYNDTINGNTTFPVIADPSGSDLNQAYMQYSYSKDTNIRFGRQRINHNEQRFIGGVAWRQNEQTFDGVRVQNKLAEGLTFDYNFSYNVNRIFGSRSPNGDLESKLHMANVIYKPADGHKLEVFAYHMDFDNAAALSNRTFGFDYETKGKFDGGGYRAHVSYATQSDVADSPFDYDADYYALDADLTFAGVTLGVGYELLGADNGRGFTTPLATLHKFNGFADLFLATPGTGLEDTFVKVATNIKGMKIVARYHNFDADEGEANFGEEFNLVATYKFTKQYSMLFKYANYNAQDRAIDTDKIWLQLVAKY